MNKFWNNYFLMNEAGAETGGEGGGGSPATPSEPAPDQQQENQNNAPDFSTGFMDENNPDTKPNEDPNQDPAQKKEEKTDDPENYDPEKAYSEFKYDLPEGYNLSEENQQKYIEMAKEKGIKPDQLQTFVNEHIQTQQGQIDEYKGIVKDWEKEIIEDPEIGGSNLAETKKNVNSVCSLKGGKEFRDVLSSTGLISNPAVVKFLNNLGKMVGNDSVITGKAPHESSEAETIKSIYKKSNY